MKKQGFTLAEVLITLTIIGVVAVLTLPSLMTNTAEQQAKTALGKMTNTITNAANMSAATLGFDFASTIEASNAGNPADETTKSISNILKNTTKLSTIEQVTGPLSTTMEARFTDGTSLFFNGAGASATDFVKKSDDHIGGTIVVFDTNGLKGPNMISNCQGQMDDKITSASADDDARCADKKNRVIKDRFMMRIRGDIVTPIGAASTWALTGSTSVNNLDKGTQVDTAK